MSAGGTISRREVLDAIREVAASMGSLREHVTTEFSAIRREIAEGAKVTGERLAKADAIRETWYEQTWPNAQKVTEALEARVRSIESIGDVRKHLEDQGARLSALEGWRMKMVGLASGIGLASGVIGWLLAKVIGL